MRTPTEQGPPTDPNGATRRPARAAKVAGRDAARRPSTGLTLFATWTLGIEAMLLVALGVAGTGSSAAAAGTVTAQTPTEVLGLRMNPAHGLLLLATGLLALAALWHPAWRRRFAASQAIGYLLLTVFGLAFGADTATMWNLNMPDHVLHAVLCLLGLTLVLMLRPIPFGPRGTGRDLEDDPEDRG
jgi:peptidoglycan/LPS O-acetylase OafA/YrhL